jgi:hypothetical protein
MPLRLTCRRHFETNKRIFMPQSPIYLTTNILVWSERAFHVRLEHQAPLSVADLRKKESK